MFGLVVVAVGGFVTYHVVKEMTKARDISGCENISCAQVSHVLTLLGYESTDERALNDLSRRLGHGTARLIVHEELTGPDWDSYCAVCPGVLVQEMMDIAKEFKFGELSEDVFALQVDIMMNEAERALGV